jgi:hypothetical protein
MLVISYCIGDKRRNDYVNDGMTETWALKPVLQRVIRFTVVPVSDSIIIAFSSTVARKQKLLQYVLPEATPLPG